MIEEAILYLLLITTQGSTKGSESLDWSCSALDSSLRVSKVLASAVLEECPGLPSSTDESNRMQLECTLVPVDESIVALPTSLVTSLS